MKVCERPPPLEAEARAELAFTRRRGTLIVIAHRMSSAMRARRVLVLDGGRALIGTHEQLLEQSALYRTLAGFWSAASLDQSSAAHDAATRRGEAWSAPRQALGH